MNDIFVDYGQFLQFNLKEQLFELNFKVINKAVPVIIESAIGQINLIRDQNTNLVIDRPEIVNVKGNRVSISNDFFSNNINNNAYDRPRDVNIKGSRSLPPVLHFN